MENMVVPTGNGLRAPVVYPLLIYYLYKEMRMKYEKLYRMLTFYKEGFPKQTAGAAY